MISQAMILAAGEGKRMRPLTLDTPKPLITINNKPLIVYHIERLKQSGIKRIVINVSYLADKLIEFFNNNHFGLDIVLSIEENYPLETAGGIKKALVDKALYLEPFILVNGDIWTDFDFGHMVSLDFFDETTLAKLYLVQNPAHHLGGDFILQNSRVFAKDGGENTKNTLTFAGISLLSPDLFQQVDYGKPTPLAPILRQAMGCGQVIGEQIKTHWIDVGTPERLAQAQALAQTLY